MECEVCGEDSYGGEVNGHQCCYDCYTSENPETIKKVQKLCEEKVSEDS